jgi:hypothetical protein
MHLQLSLIRWGLSALPISGVIWIVGSPLRGELPDPATNAPAFMAAIATPQFTWGVCINLAGLLLVTFGFLALFALLTANSPRGVALSGMLLTLLGQEMILSFYGLFLFACPLLGHLYTLGKVPADAGSTLLTNPVFVVIYIFGGLAYMIGSFLFSVALWQGRAFPKWVAVCFTLSGVVLCAGPVVQVSVPVSNILGSVLLVASGGWIAWHSRST